MLKKFYLIIKCLVYLLMFGLKLFFVVDFWKVFLDIVFYILVIGLLKDGFVFVVEFCLMINFLVN